MIELEKKWLMRQIPDFKSLGFKHHNTEQFIQSYLSKNERLRYILTLEGNIIYQYFKKTRIGDGASVEDQRELDANEYYTLLKGSVRGLKKTRQTWLDEASGLYYELDYIKFDLPRTDICVLEIEFQDRYKTMYEVDTEFTLPAYIDQYVLADVTSNDRFSNYQLAQTI